MKSSSKLLKKYIVCDILFYIQLREEGIVMKHVIRRFLTVFSAFLFCLILSGWIAVTTQAEEENDVKIMTVTVKSSGQTVKIPVYAMVEEGEILYTYIEQEHHDSDLLFQSSKEAAKVSVSVKRPDLVEKSSVKYASKISYSDQTINKSISFQYAGTGEKDSVNYYITPHLLEMKIDSLLLSTGSKGFHPSKGNYVMIRAGITMDSLNMTGNCKLRLRILNSAGKYVFQKTYTISSGGALQYSWDGKASRKNQAGVKNGAYVKNGTYQAEVSLLYAGDSTYSKIPAVTRKKKLKISSKAPSGTKGLAAAKTPLLFTGTAETDYIAEQMIQAAGIRSSMSDDEKVRRIYHYMTTNFKHVHYSWSENYKVYYNISKLKSKIRTYQKKTNKLYADGQVFYTNTYGGMYWNMARKMGVCDDHAAIFALLCNHVGIEAGTCHGYYKNRNGSLAPHAWNYAVVGGTTWYYDVDVEIQNLGKGQGDYYWYKKTKAQALQTHQFM